MSAVLDGLRVPVVQAPMAGVSGGRLAAAVSAAGGLGMVAPGPTTPASWLAAECETARGATGSAAFGVGLMAWVLPERPDLLEVVLAEPPALVSVSFGGFEPYLAPLREAGCEVTTQVGTVEEARRALDAGVDLLVVRGAEAGGHGRDAVATLPLLQEVLDVADVPVLAAGGVSGPRGLAAALAAGADGVWVGTAFMLCPEALTPAAARERLRRSGSGGTEYSSVFDRGARLGWPPEFGGRYLRSAFTERWSGRVDEIGSDDDAFAAIEAARGAGDGDALPVYAGQAAGALTDERPAAEVVADLGRGVDLLRAALEKVDAGPAVPGSAVRARTAAELRRAGSTDVASAPVLWIDVGCDGGLDLLEGNGHTFTGRMAAYCPHREVGFRVSLNEIGWMPPRTRAWVQGFLAGAEPGPDRLLGPEPDEGWYPSAGLDRWSARTRAFRLTGSWPWPDWRELPDLAALHPEEPWPDTVWMRRGDQVCFWEDGRWARSVLAEDVDDDELVPLDHAHDGESAAGLWLCRGCGLLV